jgi:hypothetical protein
MRLRILSRTYKARGKIPVIDVAAHDDSRAKASQDHPVEFGSPVASR